MNEDHQFFLHIIMRYFRLPPEITLIALGKLSLLLYLIMTLRFRLLLMMPIGTSLLILSILIYEFPMLGV